MNRLTYELGHKGSGHYDTDNSKDMPINMWIACINKLGKIEDIMEKYEINSIEELEEILKDYDDMAKDIVEMATGRKVDIKQ